MRSGITFPIIVMVIFCAPAVAYDWSTNPGNGSLENPYQISEPNHLMSIGSDPALLNKHFVLVNDIVFDPNNTPEHVFDQALIAPALDIGPNNDFIGIPFSGTFDGNHYVISNLKIDAMSSGIGFLGLFGLIDDFGTVKNTTIDNILIIGGDSSIDLGGICGGNNGLIINCATAGMVQGGLTSDLISGFCGINNGSISSSNSSCTVVGGGRYYLGGFCARNEGYIISCYSTGPLDGGDYSYCLGNFCGFNSNFIANCYSTGSVKGGNNSSNIGGLCGLNQYGSILNCYSTGLVQGGDGAVNLGGFCGLISMGVTSNCFWNVTTSAISTSASGIPLDDPNMMIQANFVDWDFVNESYCGTNDYWTMPVGSYPQLAICNSTKYVFQGAGTKEAPYLIKNSSDIGAIWQKPGSIFKLNSTIDLSGINWTCAPILSFHGLLNGDGNTIINLTINGNTTLGLFSSLAPTSLILNLGLENLNINGSADYTGGLSGINQGLIFNCYTTGLILGTNKVGGLAGGNIGGNINGCYSMASTEGLNFVGSLAGINNPGGSAANCYSTGHVTGEKYVGGLIGSNDSLGSIDHCYSISPVSGTDRVGGLTGYKHISSTIEESYFLDIAGPDNGHGIPLTEEQMKNQSSFVVWDFVGESANGDNEIWRMCVDGVDYPRLSLEFAQDGDFACGDGVDWADLQMLAEHWLTMADSSPDTFNYACDANGDGQIDLEDYSVLSGNW